LSKKFNITIIILDIIFYLKHEVSETGVLQVGPIEKKLVSDNNTIKPERERERLISSIGPT
jgi:hypothetical protein